MATTKATTEQYFHEEILWWDIIDETGPLLHPAPSDTSKKDLNTFSVVCNISYHLTKTASDPVVLHLLVNWCVKIQYTIQ
jgi:hypothetical protein